MHGVEVLFKELSKDSLARAQKVLPTSAGCRGSLRRGKACPEGEKQEVEEGPKVHAGFSLRGIAQAQYPQHLLFPVTAEVRGIVSRSCERGRNEVLGSPPGM